MGPWSRTEDALNSLPRPLNTLKRKALKPKEPRNKSLKPYTKLLQLNSASWGSPNQVGEVLNRLDLLGVGLRCRGFL